MTREEVVKDEHFEEVGEVRVDSKNRISLGRRGIKASGYKVYRNNLGQLILDPQVTIPAHEVWLFKNRKAKELVQKGLEQARRGRLVKADEDYSKYIDD